MWIYSTHEGWVRQRTLIGLKNVYTRKFGCSCHNLTTHTAVPVLQVSTWNTRLAIESRNVVRFASVTCNSKVKNYTEHIPQLRSLLLVLLHHLIIFFSKSPSIFSSFQYSSTNPDDSVDLFTSLKLLNLFHYLTSAISASIYLPQR